MSLIEPEEVISLAEKLKREAYKVIAEKTENVRRTVEEIKEMSEAYNIPINFSQFESFAYSLMSDSNWKSSSEDCIYD